MSKFTDIRALLHDRKNIEAFNEASAWLQTDPKGREPRLITGYCLKNLCEEAADRKDPKMFVHYFSMLPALRLNELDGQAMMPNRFCWAIAKMSCNLKDTPAIQHQSMTAILRMAQQYIYIKPDKYYSRLLDAAVRVKEKMERGWDGFYDFMLWWGFDNLMEEDFQRIESKDGHKSPSLAERAYTACYHSLLMQLERKQCHIDKISEFVKKLDDLIARRKAFSDTALHKARLMLAICRKEDALRAARLYARFQKNKLRAWDALGDCFEDPATRLACYCKALLCREQPKFMCATRMKAAEMMVALGLHANARLEVDTVGRIYSEEGWNIKDNVKKMIAQEWYKNATPATTNDDLYRYYAPYAEQLVR